MTDGAPNCTEGTGGNLGGSDPVAVEQTVSAIEQLADAGVRTYVVGFQTAGTNLAASLDGWSLAKDGRTVTLLGAACDEVKAGAAFDLEVRCEVVQDTGSVVL